MHEVSAEWRDYLQVICIPDANVRMKVESGRLLGDDRFQTYKVCYRVYDNTIRRGN